jgi:hypothetical protein
MLSKLVDIDEPSKDKNDSQLSKLDFQLSEQAVSKIEELNIMFEKQQSLHGKRKALIRKLLETLREDGFKDHQIVDIVLDRVKGVSRSTIYAALPQEIKRQYTKPLPKTINVAHKVIDVPSEEREQYNPEEEIKKIGEIRRAESQKQANEDDEDEDPKDLEISFLKEQKAELEEALKKTQQFLPATQLESKQQLAIALDDDTVFEYLKNRAKETGDILDFGRVGSGALVQALAQYKNSFGVVELFGRIVKK